MDNLFKNTFEPFKDILTHLEENYISFEDALELEFDVLKLNLDDFDDKLINDFWNALQNHKIKGIRSTEDLNTNNLFKNTFEPFKDILTHLEENYISFEDALELEFDVLKSNLENFDDMVIKRFWDALQNHKTNPIEKFFQDKIYFTNDLKTLLHQILEKEKNLSLDELLKMPKEKLKHFLLSISKGDIINDKLILILELEAFFINFDNNIEKGENELYGNIISASVHRNIDLQGLYVSLKNKTLESMLFLSYSNLDQTLPASFLEFIDKNNITLSQLESFSKEELKKQELDENHLSLLSGALENTKQCNLRNFNFLDLGKAFFKYICIQNLTFKDIDNMNDEQFYKIIPCNNLSQKIFNLLKQKSEFEIFLEESKICLHENPGLNDLKYIGLSALKIWNFNEFLKNTRKCNKIVKEIMKILESYNVKKEIILNKEMDLLEKKLEMTLDEKQKQENVLREPVQVLELQLNKEKSDHSVDNSQFSDPIKKKEKSEDSLEKSSQNLQPDLIKVKSELIIIKKFHENFSNEISDLLKEKILDQSALKTKFSEFAELFPAEFQNFYLNNRDSLRNVVDFSIEENYLKELTIKIENTLMDKLSDSEKKSNKYKIKSTLDCLIANRDDFWQTFLDNFCNMKSLGLFMDFLFCLNEYIPIAFDKCIPPYAQMVNKYKDDLTIMENLLNLFHDLKEIKNDEKIIINTRNLIKNIHDEGEIFLQEVNDEFPDLENYIYFEDSASNIDRAESTYNKSLSLLKEYHSKIGSSFLENVFSIDKSLKQIYFKEKKIIRIQNEEGDLETLVQRLNDECGENYKTELLQKHSCLSCSKNSDSTPTQSLFDLMSIMKNEIDPFFLIQIHEEFPEYSNINLSEKKENDENISEILEKINCEIGYFVIVSLYDEYHELRNIKIKSAENNIDTEELCAYYKFIKNNSNVNPELEDDQDKISIFTNKKKREEQLRNKIKQKMESVEPKLREIKQSIKNHKLINEEILRTIQEKERIEKELEGLMKGKNSKIEEAKNTLPDMMRLLENIFKTFKYLNLINDGLVKEIYDIYPDLHKIISLPKNNSELIDEELKILENLLNGDVNKYNINDLLEINQSINNDVLISEIIINAQNKLPIENQIVKLFFDCMKRKEIFSETIRSIQKVIPKFEINSSNLLEHLLNISNDSLKIMLLNICSRISAIPFLIRRNIKDDEFNLIRDEFNPNYRLITELVYILEDSCTNLLSFSFSKNKYSCPKGKTFILNNFFGRNFLTGDNLITKTLIEFQFDFHYAQPLKLNVADYHGQADIDIVKNLIPFFNLYFVHLRSEEFGYFKQDINDLTSRVKESHDKFIFIVFIHQQKSSKINIKEENGVFYCKVDSIRNMPETEIRNLKDEIWKLIINENCEIHPSHRILMAKRRYIDICRSFNETGDVNYISERQKIIEEFENYVYEFSDDFMDIRLLPFNNTFVEYCEKLRIYNNNNMNMIEKNKNEESKKIYELLIKHENQDISPIVNKFYELLYDEHFLCILYDASFRLKSKIEEKLSPYQKEMNEKINQINKNKDEKQKENLEKERKGISEIIKKKSFSFEFIVRELYHIHRNVKLNSGMSEKKYFERLSRCLISCGQPFEVIDGDNLHFISDIYGNLLKNHHGNVLVISIMGPQSSGKSTLLNFLFGTQFASSSGRCTRGMYGAIMDIKNHEKYEKLLILDSEGIFSTERNDRLFDRKLILFCLCISHITILCNKGDMHKEMTDVLKLTRECMKDLKEQKFLNPDVFVVLNALTDINKDKLMSPLQNLDIDLKDVEMLPFAYEMKNVHSDIKVNIPSTSFSKKCLEFRNKILNQYRINPDQDIYTLSEWFEFSQKIWDKIDKLKNLINYTNLEEMKQGEQLSRLIKGYLKDFKNMMSKDEQDNLELDLILENEVKDFDIENFYSISDSVNNCLDRRAQERIEKMLKEFEGECEERNISPELMYRNKKLFEMNLNRCIEDWKLILSQKLNVKKVEKSRFGDSVLNSNIDGFMKENKYQPYDEKTALHLFDTFWDQEISNLKKKHKLNLETKKEKCYNLIKKNYDGFNKLLTGRPDREKILKEFYKTKDLKIIQEFITRQDLLFFQNQKIPNIKAIYEHLQHERKYWKIPKNLFDVEEKCSYVKISPSMAFKKNLFKKDDFEKKTTGFFRFFSRKNSSKNEIKDILETVFYNIKCEAEKNYIKFDYDYRFIKDSAKKIHTSLDLDLQGTMNSIYNEICKRFTVIQSDYFEEPNDIPIYFDKKLLLEYSECNKDQFDNLKSYDPNILRVEYVNKYKTTQPQPINEMLCWYIEPKYNIMNPEKRNTGKSFFDNFFDWNCIFDEILYFVLESVYKNDPQFKNLNFFDEINKFHMACVNNTNLGDDIEKSFCLFDSEVVQRLITNTEKLIHDIDQEMKIFNYQINTETYGIFHEIVMTFFWTLYTLQDFYRDNAIIRTNEKNRECYKNFFVSSLTKDSNADKGLAKIISDKLEQKIKDKLLEKAQRIFQADMKKNENIFETKNGMKILDELIKSRNQNIKVILEYMLNPRERLRKMFECEWNEKAIGICNNINKGWCDEFEGSLELLKIFFSKLQEDMKSRDLLKNSNILFTILENNEIKTEKMAQEEHETLFNKLMAKYIHDSIEGDWNEDKLVIKDGIKVKPVKNFPKIEIIMDEFLRRELQSELKEKPIINISVFLTEILLLLEKSIKNVSSTIPKIIHLDNQDLNKRLEKEFIGCYHACPLCKRKCDQAHTDFDKTHKCATGHQFKVFGGTRFQNNDPSFLSCDMMDDKDEVEYDGDIINWSEFKLIHKDWDFTCKSSLEKVEFIERNKEIWNLIRKDLCDHYLENEKIQINKIDWCIQKKGNLKNSIKRTHLILLLDDSGSMYGTWDDLIKAVSSTFETIINKNILRKYTKISVLQHSSTTITSFEEKEASLDLIASIQPRFDGTNFSEAISQGYETILSTKDKYDTFIVGFMTDGCDSIPTEIINKINEDKEKIKNKINFNCILFGEDEDGKKTQEEIAKALGGKYTNAITFEDLKSSFIEILNVKK